MKSVPALAASFAALAVIACSSSDGREASLRETVADYVATFQDRDAAKAYDFNHDSFKDKCDTGATDQIFESVDLLYGDTWDHADLRILWIDVDEEHATVDYDLYVDGRSIGFGEPDIFWLYEDGRWWRASDDIDPCSANKPFGFGFWSVSSLEEAAVRAGYVIATAHFVPDGYEPFEFISVTNNPRRGRSVQQIWDSVDGSSRFTLDQHPTQFKLGDGEPFDIGGLSGDRSLQPVDSTRSQPLLTLLWHEGEFTFILSALLTGSLTEEVLLDVAASVEFD